MNQFIHQLCKRADLGVPWLPIGFYPFFDRVGENPCWPRQLAGEWEVRKFPLVVLRLRADLDWVSDGKIFHF